jgi:N,N'-diacetyllegionaminate synthase
MNTPFIIAEAGVNHNGRLDLALKLVDAAAAAGADAVKFQTFRAAALAAAQSPLAEYQRAGAGKSRDMRKMLEKLELSESAHRKILARCRKRKILFLSSPFDEASADFLAGLGMTIFKVPSGELTNPRLLARVAQKRKPVLLSTGMSLLPEIRAALSVIKKNGNPPVTLLQCTSRYPTPPEHANVRAMLTLGKAFGRPVGFSDHTPGIGVSVAAVALGAKVIEKHFTLDKKLPGPDHAMSLSPAELADLVKACRAAAIGLGDGRKALQPGEKEIQDVARRSLVLARPLKKGERLRERDVLFKRPGTGISPMDLARAVGRKLKKDKPADAVLSWSDLA